MGKVKLQSFLEGHIPAVLKMNYELTYLDEQKAESRMPLGENGNHRGSAFGGSLYNSLVLTCYSWLYGWLMQKNYSSSIVIQSANIEYLLESKEPEIFCKCESPEYSALQKFESQLQQKAKARLELTSLILSAEGEKLARLTGKFVVFRKDHFNGGT